jgi:hypothetical protein
MIITLNIDSDEKINNKAHAGEKNHSHEDNVKFCWGGVKMGLQQI